jgi:copper resistance protein B
MKVAAVFLPETPARARWRAAGLRLIAASVAFALLASPALAQEPSTRDTHQAQEPSSEQKRQEHTEHARQEDPGPAGEHQDASHPPQSTVNAHDEMDMGSMGGGRAPPDARDPHAYSEGYEYAGMPGLETSDEIVFGWISGDELEFVSGNEGDGFAWNVQANYGDDRNKLWLRTQGLRLPGELDPTTSGEILWWRPYSAFWGTQLGIRQDFGAGAHTYAAFGIEGLAPFWFIIEATGYLCDDGRLSARVKVSYDLRITNRLILTPNLEANAYSEADDERNLGSGLGNIEGGLRLRYEVQRKFAPYVGYVWERSFSGTADRRRAQGDPVNEHRFVAGFRMWF